ncbi:MAG: MFS transporter [Burkholderiales bacterium]
MPKSSFLDVNFHIDLNNLPETNKSAVLRAFEAVSNLRALAALRYREYRLLWFSGSFGNLSFWMDEVTRGWLIYELTDSAVQLGLVRGVQAIPFFLFSPFAGSAADRYSRKGQLVAAQAVNALIYVVIAALVFAGEVLPWHVYVTSFLVATAHVFQQPVRASLVSDAVPRDYLTNAIGLNSLTFNTARGVGPALAGVLIVTSGTAGAFAAQAFFLIIAMACTIPMLSVQHNAHMPGGKPRESFFSSILEGWKFSWHNQEVRASLLCAGITALFIIPFTTLLPVFARDLLNVGATGQGLLLTAMGCGAFISAAIVASAGHRLPRGLMMLVSGVLYGISLIGFAASPWFELSLVVMFLAGLVHVYCSVLVMTMVQSYSPPEFRGRTMAVFSMTQALITVGAMLFGLFADLIDARWSMAIMGATGSLFVVGLYFAMPSAKHVR